MYGTVEGVSARVPGIGTIDGASTPTDDQVETWLTEASALIDTALAAAGYSSPVDASVSAYTNVTGLAELYAAATTLEAQGIDTLGGGTENRSEAMFERFYRELKLFVAGDLTVLGVSLLVTPVRRRRIRTLQMRRVDGYSRGATTDWEVVQGEYTGASAPSE